MCIRDRRTNVLLLDDFSGDQSDQHVQSIAHGVITLERSNPDYGAARRKVAVEKLRGSPFSEGQHDFVLRRGGMTVFSRLTAGSQSEGVATELSLIHI